MMPMIKETPFNDKTQNNTTLKSWIDDSFYHSFIKVK